MLQGGQVITGMHSRWHNRYAIYATVYTVHSRSALYEDMHVHCFASLCLLSVVAAEVYVYCTEVLFCSRVYQ